MRRFWIIVVVVFAFAGWGVWRIVELPAFRVATVAVTGLPNDSHVTSADVLGHARIDAKSNVWLLDRGAIERRIEAIPYVATARVIVRPPAAVTLDVSERTIDGCVRDGASHVLTIDPELRVLAQGCDAMSAVAYAIREPIDVLPGAYVRSSELIALQNDRRALAADGDAYRSFSHDAFGQLQATSPAGILVKFGDDADLDRKERLVGPILAQVSGQGRPIVAVDVRAVATPVVEFRPERPVKQPVHPHAVDKL